MSDEYTAYRIAVRDCKHSVIHHARKSIEGNVRGNNISPSRALVKRARFGMHHYSKK